jgi:hypothetical protein
VEVQVSATIVTALAAVVVFVVTQSFLKLVLEPIQEQRRLIGEVASALTVYEKAYTLKVVNASGGEALFGATPEEAKEAEKALRELAGRLRSSTKGPREEGSARPRDTAEFPIRGGSLTRPWWRRVSPLVP